MTEDVIKALKLGKGLYIDKNHVPVYRFTNENLSEVVCKMDVKDKKILTVCSSGDHYLNFLLNGASSIDTFDINIFTKYYADLKIASVAALTYEEFFDFYFSSKSFFSKKDAFDYNIYLKVRNYIKDDNSLFFWDSLFNNLDSSYLYNSMFFMNKCDVKGSVIKCNDYLKSRNNYDLLKSKLFNSNVPSFKCVDVFDNNIDINKTYDIVYLSNILDYTYFESTNEYFEFLKNFVDKMSNLLNEDGELMLNYLFCYLDDYWGCFKDIKLAYLYQSFCLDRGLYKVKPFSGGISNNGNMWKNRDAIVLCKKRNK